jgi:hypothetical protein
MGGNTLSYSGIIVDTKVVIFLLGDMALFKVIEKRDVYLKDRYYPLQVGRGYNEPYRNGVCQCTASVAVDPARRCLQEAGVCRPNGRHSGDYRQHSLGVA